MHLVDGKNGIKDFDVWSFFSGVPGQPIPRRPVIARDFGQPQFGTSADRPDFIGRKVDLLLKSIPGHPDGDPVRSLRDYLTERRTATARCLAAKAVVLIEPIELAGTVAWPQA